MNAVHIVTTGMHCDACPPLIEAEVERIPGVKAARAYRGLEITSVLFDPEKTDAESIRERIAGAGFGAQVIVGGSLRHN
jgi:copper chaperone CopZ